MVSEAGNSFPCLSYVVRELACYLREVTYAGHQAGVVFHALVGPKLVGTGVGLPKFNETWTDVQFWGMRHGMVTCPAGK